MKLINRRTASVHLPTSTASQLTAAQTAKLS